MLIFTMVIYDLRYFQLFLFSLVKKNIFIHSFIHSFIHVIDESVWITHPLRSQDLEIG